jgi:LDH2 family malate/lactate/ureidoglycolate dehydrogenase
MMRVAADKLADLIAAICRRSGSEEDEAQLVARHLVASNLAGHDSHGVGMLPTYIEHALDGRLKLNLHAQAPMRPMWWVLRRPTRARPCSRALARPSCIAS